MVEVVEPHHWFLSFPCYFPFLRQESEYLDFLLVSVATWQLRARLFIYCVLVVFGFYIYWTLTDAMGQTDSHSLNIVLAHFKEVRTRAHNLLVDVKKGK